MNNACPTCGAVYAVATKDIGRKIKCKKCSTALLVDDTGLVIDAPVAAAVVVPPLPQATPAVPADDFATGDDATVAKKKAKKYADRGPGGGGFGAVLAQIGGVPTILFCLGVFLVIWFTFMPIIGDAATLRAEEYKNLLKHELTEELRALLPKDKQMDGAVLSDDEKKAFDEKSKSIQESYRKRFIEAESDAKRTTINNKRDIWFEHNGTMFGFLFLAFGCVGYLRTEQTLILRIVAAVVLSFMLMVVFSKFGGCGGMPKL
jgi:predicted Zn finger-like uncharacterized protein